MLIDLHADVISDVEERREAGERAVLSRRYRSRWEKGGVKAALTPVGGDSSMHPMDLSGCVRLIQWVQAEVAESEGWLVIARSPAQLEQAVGRGQFPLVLTLEGGRPLQGQISNLYLLADLGVSMLGLTHNYRNELADGIGQRRTRGGLTSFGVDVVHAAGEGGLGIDVSHLAEAGFWDVMDEATGSVIASHSCARAVWDHPRNLSDEQLRALAERGGVVGVAFLGTFVSGERPAAAHVLRHIAHMESVMGPGHVGIGPDFVDYALDRLAAEIARNPVQSPGWQDFPPGLESIDGLAALPGLLMGAGYEEAAVAGMLGRNFLRAWQQWHRPRTADA